VDIEKLNLCLYIGREPYKRRQGAFHGALVKTLKLAIYLFLEI
jgi:hypothetical protein